MNPGRTQCRAGFWHVPGDVCDHVVPLPSVAVKLPPDHDTVRINGQGQITRTYKQDGFYSEEATAARKVENRLKYAPTWQRERIEDERKRLEQREEIPAE